MSNTFIRIDSKDIIDACNRVGAELVGKSVYQAVSEALTEAKDVVRSEFSNSTGIAVGRRGKGSGKKGGTRTPNPISFHDAVKAKMGNNGMGGIVWVDSSSSGNWLMRIFNTGTGPRYRGRRGSSKNWRKKQDKLYDLGGRHGYTGQIKESNYFDKAMDKIESTMPQKVAEKIMNAINNAW